MKGHYINVLLLLLLLLPRPTVTVFEVAASLSFIWFHCHAVGDPPKILKPFKDLTVVAPNSAVLECRIEPGEPEPKVRCFKDNKELYNGAKYQIDIEGESVKLVVSNTELADASKYRCEAANKLGKVETAAQLTVHSMYFDCWLSFQLCLLCFSMFCLL